MTKKTRPTKALSNDDIQKLLAERREIAVFWHIDDVLDMRPDLTKEQAWEVLRPFANNTDTSWDTIREAADYLHRNRYRCKCRRDD